MDKPLICACYSCNATHEYLDSDLYEYYDAQFGIVMAFTCKDCGLTNDIR